LNHWFNLYSGLLKRKFLYNDLLKSKFFDCARDRLGLGLIKRNLDLLDLFLSQPGE